jgi:hypothetical protein
MLSASSSCHLGVRLFIVAILGYHPGIQMGMSQQKLSKAQVW